ncbi:MAG: nucleotidyl transferase AbiEii/AbiGii toxin family protein [Candidatus Omnitrophota bacterium]
MKKQIDINQLESLRKELGFSDRGIFEKTVYAFNLLDELLGVYSKLVFKGGTSILLHIFPPARLSIDIDILLPLEERAGLKGALVKMISTSQWFNIVKENIRGSKIPKAHYKFQFTSHFSKEQQYILLDVVFTKYPYKKLVEKNISKFPLVFFNSNAVVSIPTPEGLLGDKMTAISPKTIGIPLNEKRSMECVKQIIDLNELFNIASDINDMKQSFLNTVQQENDFRGTAYSMDEVLNDVIDIAFKYSQALLKGADNSFSEIALIDDGLAKVTNHLGKKVNKQDIKIAYAKIVYMASMFKNKENPRLIKNIDLSLTQGMTFPKEYKILERLQAVIPEAYFYWALAIGAKN